MSDNFMDGTKSTNSLYDGIEQDNGMDLLSLVKQQEKEETTTEPESMTPLQMAIKKEETENHGVIVTKEEEEKYKEKPKVSPVYNEERMNAIGETIDSYDDTLKQRAAVVQIKEAKDASQYVKMMDEISNVKFDESGKAYFNTNTIPEFVRIRTESDPPFTNGSDDSELTKVPGEKKEIESDNTFSDDKIESEETSISENDEKNKVVEIIIDKTGLGANLEFSDEEMKKIVESREIRLKEVEVLEVGVDDVETEDSSAFQSMINEYSFNGSKTTICFPASGFHAQMAAMTYGEYEDIAIDMETITFDLYYKRLSVIYNKMKNISVGQFPDFMSFLDNFAYTDIELAVYALAVSTFPEIQTIELQCGNDGGKDPEKKCNKKFNYNFQTRNLLQLDKCDIKFLDKMQELATASPAMYDEIYKKSPLKAGKLITLPFSKIRFEMGVVSARDFLYNFIPMLDQKTFISVFGENAKPDDLENVMLLTAIRSVAIPNPATGKYVKAKGFKDIISALYKISPEEIKIVRSLAAKIIGVYQAHFSFGKVICPHCGYITPNLEVNIDELVFQIFNRLRSTEINVENISVI